MRKKIKRTIEEEVVTCDICDSLAEFVCDGCGRDICRDCITSFCYAPDVCYTSLPIYLCKECLKKNISELKTIFVNKINKEDKWKR